jgi:hypothetical protein
MDCKLPDSDHASPRAGLRVGLTVHASLGQPYAQVQLCIRRLHFTSGEAGHVIPRSLWRFDGRYRAASRGIGTSH